MNNDKNFTKCPCCGSTQGLYSKEKTTYCQYYTFDGNEAGYSDHDIAVRKKFTPLYCMTCHERVTTLEKLTAAKEGR